MIEPRPTSAATPRTPIESQDLTLDSLRILYLCGPLSPPNWLHRALEVGAGGAMEVTETPSLRTALERLREHAYEVVVVDRDASDRPAADLICAIQASTHDHQAILILADGDDRLEATDYLMAGATGYLSLRQSTTQELVWQLHSAARQAHLHIENIRLRAWQQRYREQEQREVLSLLEEQSAMFGVAARLRMAGGDSTAHGQSAPSADATKLTRAFRELLQAYVVMGRGQMASEVQRLADSLRGASGSRAQTLRLFTAAIQSLVQDRGARSSRHIFNRGNLLLLDLLLQAADPISRKETHEHHDCHSSL